MVIYKGIGEKVIAELKSIGLLLLTKLPENWNDFMELCAGKKDQPFLTLEELDLWFPVDKDHIILQYLHEIEKSYGTKKSETR